MGTVPAIVELQYIGVREWEMTLELEHRDLPCYGKTNKKQQEDFKLVT